MKKKNKIIIISLVQSVKTPTAYTPFLRSI